MSSSPAHREKESKRNGKREKEIEKKKQKDMTKQEIWLLVLLLLFFNHSFTFSVEEMWKWWLEHEDLKNTLMQ